MSAEIIIGNWKKKLFKPLYWLEGEEGYYIDKVMNYAEHNLLPTEEASFNLTVFYGKDANWGDVLNACMRYPMFAERQVVLLKEAQHMRDKDLENLENYFQKPLPTTIFVASYKEKKLDKRKAMYKALTKNGEVLTTEKISDYKLAAWVKDYLQTQQVLMKDKAVALLTEHIGADLSRIVNEIEKITVNLGSRKEITEDDIEKYVGVSKEYNVFELQDAIGKKNMAKAFRIIQYFEYNPKAAPIQLVLPSLYGYFSKLYAACGMADRGEAALRPLFYNNPYAAKEAAAALKLYGYEGVEKTLLLLHEYNLKSIGINNASTDGAGLLKEMVVKIIR
ncbi:MAG TPA: DNA polymerase III subunit delta [Ferruginibacter sp.]|nr:DNA polymerase III subunit delta [Ferruginibacter sp.]HMP20100.1 DNA polymerase III subunit delta [Ferruginibacter sp.]